ncbi:RHS repeat-associated core domain-containing protein [Pseudoduganella sp. R-34]|uniref:RHS repeat-associated core domain-containing protein n=1 Tax=Pseudoduganella sp. R-34 TaxID=3404062 RepID=UPI003CF8C141
MKGFAKHAELGVEIYNIYADHIDAPRVITSATSKAMVWRWDTADPFGASMPNENPNGAGIFTYNPRMPGQLYDKETNLFYNYFRDYDPALGRYVQSDPIGLRGGINTYGYVGGDPVSFVDPEGLEKIGVFGTSPHPPYTAPDNPVFQQRVSEYTDRRGTFFIYGHGYPGGIWDGVNNQYITTPDQLANLLKKNGWKVGQPVVIYACRTGKKQDDGKPGIAEQFAKKYKTPTRAPTRQVWYNQNPSANGPSWIYGKNKDGSMNTNDPGEMKDF